MITKTRLYCFVDETGQDTKGELFLVAIFLHETESLDLIEERLQMLETETGKKKLKWKKTSKGIKKEYLSGLLKLRELRGSIYYSTYLGTKEYSKLTSLTIAKAILAKVKGEYEVTIIIDGLNSKEREVVTRELKRLRIKYRKVRGMKDEQSVFLRLADAMAGFLRDASQKQIYTKQLVTDFVKRSVVSEI